MGLPHAKSRFLTMSTIPISSKRRTQNSDYNKNDGKNTEKDNKFKKNSYTSSPRAGLDGDVDGVDRKTSPAQKEATKVGPKICNT